MLVMNSSGADRLKQSHRGPNRAGRAVLDEQDPHAAFQWGERKPAIYVADNGAILSLVSRTSTGRPQPTKRATQVLCYPPRMSTPPRPPRRPDPRPRPPERPQPPPSPPPGDRPSARPTRDPSPAAGSHGSRNCLRSATGSEKVCARCGTRTTERHNPLTLRGIFCHRCCPVCQEQFA